jgi:hypothetical protein
MSKPELRLVPTYPPDAYDQCGRLRNADLPSVTHPPAFDQHGFPVVQTHEILVAAIEPVTANQYVLPAVQTCEIGRSVPVANEVA